MFVSVPANTKNLNESLSSTGGTFTDFGIVGEVGMISILGEYIVD